MKAHRKQMMVVEQKKEMVDLVVVIVQVDWREQ